MLLAQIYAPLEEADVGHAGAFHRALYVACCAAAKCTNAPGRAAGAVRAWRCQLPRENAHLPFEGDVPMAPRATGGGGGGSGGGAPPLCIVCDFAAPQRCAKCRGPRYCSRAHQLAHWRAGHKNVCGGGGEGLLEARGLVEHARDLRAAIECGAVLPEWDVSIDDEPTASEMDASARASLPPAAAAALRELEAGGDAAAAAGGDAAAAGGGAAAAGGDEAAGAAAGAATDAAAGAAADAAAGAAAATGGAAPPPADAAEAAADAASIDTLTQAELGAATGTAVDPVLTTFLARVAVEPAQVLRYCRWPAAGVAGAAGAAGAAGGAAAATAAAAADEDDGDDDGALGAPLWFSSAHQPRAEDIAPCGQCGAPRAFEFQVMPQALHYVLPGGEAKIAAVGDAVTIDFGTLAVFTCTRSCAGAECAEELCWVQPQETAKAAR